MHGLKHYFRDHPLFFWCLTILVIELLLISISGFNGLYGQDAYEYLKLVRSYADYASSGEISYSVFPGFYPLTGFLLTQLIHNDIFSLQCISVIAILLAFIYLYQLIRLLYPENKNSAVYLFLFFFLSPYILRFSVISMSDMLNLFLCIACFYHVLIFKQQGVFKQLVFASAYGVCAVYTRYASAVFLFIPAILLLWKIVQMRKWGYLLAPLILLVIIALPEYFLRQRFLFWDFSGSSTEFVYATLPQEWSIGNFFKKDFYNADGWQHYDYPNLLFVFQNWLHPAFIFCGIVFFMRSAKKLFQDKTSRIISGIIILYALFCAGTPYQNNRYLLLTFPLILLLFFPAFSRLSELLANRRYLKIFSVAGIIIIQVSLFLYSSRTIYTMNKNEKTIAGSVRQLPYECVIYQFSLDGALHAYDDDHVLFDIYAKKIDTVTAPCAYLLFNPDVFPTQFENLNPMINWNKLNENYQLEETTSYAGGWRLYAIRTSPAQKTPPSQ